MTLEKLLNILCEKGWKPRGEEEIKSCQIGKSFYDRKFIESSVGFYIDDRGTPQRLFTKSLREVCSKSSGLWQFVCDNGMIKIEYGKIREKYDETIPTKDKNNVITYRQLLGEDNYEYRVIESSLKDESELEEFLLNSIKLD